MKRGLIFSEAVAMVLRKKLGRSQSHQLLEDASRRAVEQNQSLQDVLLKAGWGGRLKTNVVGKKNRKRKGKERRGRFSSYRNKPPTRQLVHEAAQ